MKRRKRQFEIGPCVRCGKRRGNYAGYCNPCNVWKFAQTHPEYAEKQREYRKKYLKKYHARHKDDPVYIEKRREIQKKSYYKNILKRREYQKLWQMRRKAKLLLEKVGSV